MTLDTPWPIWVADEIARLVYHLAGRRSSYPPGVGHIAIGLLGKDGLIYSDRPLSGDFELVYRRGFRQILVPRGLSPEVTAAAIARGLARWVIDTQVIADRVDETSLAEAILVPRNALERLLDAGLTDEEIARVLITEVAVVERRIRQSFRSSRRRV